MDKIRAHVIVRGQVQGVGFRAWTQYEARQRGLVGWVKNLSDGSVEAVIEGKEAIIRAFVIELRKGPRFADVHEHIAEFSEELEGFENFEIIRY